MHCAPDATVCAAHAPILSSHGPLRSPTQAKPTKRGGGHAWITPERSLFTSMSSVASWCPVLKPSPQMYSVPPAECFQFLQLVTKI